MSAGDTFAAFMTPFVAFMTRATVDDLVCSWHVQNKDAQAIATLSAVDMDGQEELRAALNGLALSLNLNVSDWPGAMRSDAAVAEDPIWCGGVSGAH